MRDGHILEPDLLDKYIDREFRERRPRFVVDERPCLPTFSVD
jgi:hypothetical protein